MSYDMFTRVKVPKTVEKTRNAYMLIYQRKATQPMGDNALPVQPSPSLDYKDDGLSTGGYRKLLEYVWADNMRFLHEKKLFDPTYFNFLCQLVDLNSDVNEPGEYAIHQKEL